MAFSASGVLHPCQAFVGPRFAMWLLGQSAATSASHKVTDLLLEDRQLMLQLATESRPTGRLLLPLAAAPNPDQHCKEKLWVDGVDVNQEHRWAKALQQQQHRGFVALTVFNQPARPGRAPRVSNVPGCIGTRLLLSNDHVRLWDFDVPPQMSCELHEHLHSYMFINRTACKTRGLDEALHPEEPAASFAACEFRCIEVNEKERHVHAFMNPGKVAVNQYIVEFIA